MRLDKFLYEKGYFQSRAKAKEYIEKGLIKVDEKVVKKPSFDVKEGSKIDILKKEDFVSRAANKLEYFLKDDEFIKDKICLDIGASTGGFTQVLLKKGAKKVFALDVGKAQLHKRLLENPKIVNLEKTDIRDFFPKDRFDIVTCDVSFISLNNILNDIDRVSKYHIITLFKPQFEVGKDVKRDKKGVVIDKEAIKNSMKNFEKRCLNLGWKLLRKEESKVKGKEGNIEYFYHFKKENSE